ncbi:transcriptional and immune response regulator-like [Scyliorhinus canicula]|uniref:transcriptional and immune response regulator-like n=1 Tax=Scyliorhinus canicula TaxID=7830 RepID=UPI0018F2999B|nr:transcriptional and immune response regulator-like [Scyliorhinus canicula]
MATTLENECYAHRVSPQLVSGQRFDTDLRKRAAPNIFEAVNQAALQRLFERSGDKRAEERARIIATNQDSEHITRSLVALKLRKRMKFMQLFRMGSESVKMSSFR